MNHIRKWDFDFVRIKGEPANFRADGLLFQFSTSPNKRRANDCDDHTQPIVLNERGSGDDKKSSSHHVGPANIAKDSFTANDERKAKSDDEQGDNADENAEEIHGN